MSDYTQNVQAMSNNVSHTVDWETKYNELLREHSKLQENFRYTVEEARKDRDFYMDLYQALLHREGVAA